ncbi:DUF2232 domain-containing protein [Pinisolibacter sp.]|uniref:DUF2232 domain-containing protein n=1 Tax=Pinisolibacter sp. TaxID=2172024 RepID=UPI002FDE6824
MTRSLSAPPLLIGLGAGFATALLFAALVGGTMLALPLFLLAPLPLGIAAIGWGTIAGLVATATAAATVWVGFGTPAGVSLLLLDALPTLAAAHLLGLARQSDPADPASREWYPLGRALLAICVTVAVATVIGGISIGFDPQETAKQVSTAYRHMMVRGGVSPAEIPDASLIDPMVRGTVLLFPAFFPASWLLVIVFDLWAAVKIVAKSGRLTRPFDDAAAVELPPAAGLAFAAAFAAAFAEGSLGVLASIVAGTLFSAHFLVGAGVIHTLARRSQARIIILAFIWGLVLLFTLPAAFVALVGLLEPYVGLRRRKPSAGPF